MHETVTIQLGQCGNQIGNEFWSKIKEEHETEQAGSDRRDRFFYSTEGGNIAPRAVLVDTEPRAIFGGFSNHTNTFLTNEGTGASNNWAHGFSLAKAHAEEMMEIINRNVEACDNMETIQCIHSCAGGTGSGFSSYLGEILHDFYPKKIFYDFAVLPNNNEASDVVVQPYNTIMNLHRAKENFDLTVVMDNFALAKQTDLTAKKVHSYENMNSVAADVISAFSSSVRFPTFLYTENRSILNTLVPSQDQKFIVPSIVKSNFRKFSTGEIVNNLIKQKSMLCSYEPSTIYGFTSIWNVLERNLDVASVVRSQRLVQNKINFLDLPYYTTAITNKRDVNVSFNNSTGIRNTIGKIAEQFDKLMKRAAFVESYRRFGLEVEEMKAARESIQGLIEGYEGMEAK